MSTSGSVAGDRQRIPKEQRGKAKATTPDDDDSVDMSTGVSVTSSGMKLPTPSKFSGKKGTLNDFLNQTDLYMAFYHDQFAEPEARNLFLISYLEGDAAAALRPQFDEFLQAKEPGRMQDDKTPFTNKRNYVRSLLIFYFKDTTETRKLERQLMTVHQKGAAMEYTAKFRGISSRLEWSEDAQMAQYRRGLKEEIKDELALQDDILDLKTLITRVHAIDNRQYERRLERKSAHAPAKKDRKENVSATSARNPRKSSKGSKGKGKGRARDLSQVECYNCHKKGHYKNKCPQQEQVAAVTTPTCKHESFLDCGNDNCTIHWEKKDAHARYQAKLSQQIAEDDSWELDLEGTHDLPKHQVAMANSEAYVSEDDTAWGPTSSSDGELVNEENESSEEEELSSDAGAWVGIAQTLSQVNVTNENLIQTYRERLSYAEARAMELHEKLQRAEQYAIRVSTENPMNALIDALTPGELAEMVRNATRLGLVAKFEQLFQKMAKEVSEGDKGGLAVIEAIVAQEVRKSLQGDGCADPLDMVHIKMPRGSTFLKNGAVLLPDRRLVPWALRNHARVVAKQIRDLPVHEEEIPPDRFLTPTDPGEDSEESKN